MFTCSIARIYAQVIFDLAVEKKTFEEWKMMLNIAVQISCDTRIKHTLSGVLSSRYIAKIFNTIGAQTFTTQFKNLIQVMANNKRLNVLNEVLKEFIRLNNNDNNIIDATVISYSRLHKYQLDNICNFLKQKFNKTINLESKIDNSIIDGFIIKVNDTVINMSIHNRLKQLEYFLQS